MRPCRPETHAGNTPGTGTRPRARRWPDLALRLQNQQFGHHPPTHAHLLTQHCCHWPSGARAMKEKVLCGAPSGCLRCLRSWTPPLPETVCSCFGDPQTREQILYYQFPYQLFKTNSDLATKNPKTKQTHSENHQPGGGRGVQSGGAREDKRKRQ